MKKNIIAGLTGSIATVLLVSCASSTTTVGPKNLTEDVLQKIVPGQTTKAEVRELLGNPGSIAQNSFGNPWMESFIPPEQWTYSRLDYNHGGFFDLKNGEGRKSTILIVGFTNGVVSAKTLNAFQIGNTPDIKPGAPH